MSAAGGGANACCSSILYFWKDLSGRALITSICSCLIIWLFKIPYYRSVYLKILPDVSSFINLHPSLENRLSSNTNGLYLFIDVQSSWKPFILSRMIFLEHERSSKLADQTLTRQFRSARRIYWRKFFSQIKTSADYPWWTTGEIEQEQADGSLLPDECSCEDFSRGTRWAQPEAERMPAVHHERYSPINFARNLCSIQKQHSNVSRSIII